MPKTKKYITFLKNFKCDRSFQELCVRRTLQTILLRNRIVNAHTYAYNRNLWCFSKRRLIARLSFEHERTSTECTIWTHMHDVLIWVDFLGPSDPTAARAWQRSYRNSRVFEYKHGETMWIKIFQKLFEKNQEIALLKKLDSRR